MDLIARGNLFATNGFVMRVSHTDCSDTKSFQKEYAFFPILSQHTGIY